MNSPYLNKDCLLLIARLSAGLRPLDLKLRLVSRIFFEAIVPTTYYIRKDDDVFAMNRLSAKHIEELVVAEGVGEIWYSWLFQKHPAPPTINTVKCDSVVDRKHFAKFAASVSLKHVWLRSQSFSYDLDRVHHDILLGGLIYHINIEVEPMTTNIRAYRHLLGAYNIPQKAEVHIHVDAPVETAILTLAAYCPEVHRTRAFLGDREMHAASSSDKYVLYFVYPSMNP
jgi:hypothetical protein